MQKAPTRRVSFEQWLANAPTEYLICRDMGHAWPNDGWAGDHCENRRDGSHMLHMICERCGLPRERYIGGQGEIDSKWNRLHYDKIPGYLFSDDGFVLNRERRMQLRRELLRRATEERHKRVVPIPFRIGA